MHGELGPKPNGGGFIADDKFEVTSAGVEASFVRPLAIEAMREIGIDISGHHG